ncbi:hypothetical protein RvY_16117 [Ramazzottius varieornatus]|uniref:Uncharacterized protein n=1 Tax=Ramazzottius varieornatus TaxID=947166 RepID=A0A1D1VXB7_RAMVA|nr:hypothetical protein RvY_16117 [Ramazzottius varieornatus]
MSSSRRGFRKRKLSCEPSSRKECKWSKTDREKLSTRSRRSKLNGTLPRKPRRTRKRKRKLSKGPRSSSRCERRERKTDRHRPLVFLKLSSKYPRSPALLKAQRPISNFRNHHHLEISKYRIQRSLKPSKVRTLHTIVLQAKILTL